MKFLFASDSFKGTLFSEKTVELLTKAANEVFDDCECDGVAVADGGEGTADAVIKAVKGEKIRTAVHGPLMEKRKAYFGKIDNSHAILEMAAASGLPLVPPEKLDPRRTSTYGTGELIRVALEQGFTNLTIAIGGSATNDGGMGCMRALGIRFLDKDGNELEGTGQDLIRVSHIDATGILEEARNASYTIMCDVNCPLCGEFGATRTFGKQKGGTPEILEELEAGMRNYRNVIVDEFGINPDDIPGAGAAGGLGAALLVFLHAELKSGIETVLDLIDFDRRLDGVSLVVTGEGSTDWQSCYGKVVQGVGMRCKKRGIPAVALVGSMGNGAENIFSFGVESLFTTVSRVLCLEEVLARAEEDYYSGAIRMFRILRVGAEMKR